MKRRHGGKLSWKEQIKCHEEAEEFIREQRDELQQELDAANQRIAVLEQELKAWQMGVSASVPRQVGQ